MKIIERSGAMKDASRLFLALLLGFGVLSVQAVEDEAFQAAERSADIAGYSLSKVQRWLHEVALKQIDPDCAIGRVGKEV